MNVRLVAAGCIATVGLLVALRALQRTPHSLPPPSPDGSPLLGENAPASDDRPPHPPDLPEWKQLKFRSYSVSESVQAVGAALDSDELWAPLDLPVRDREYLRERALARIEYVLEGSTEGHRAQAEIDGAIRIDPPEGLSPESLARLSMWPAVWRNAPVDSAHVVVRRLDYSSDESASRSMTAIVSRSPLSAEYPGWPAGVETEIIEIVIPLRPLGPDGERRIEAFLGVPYERPRAGGDWRPRRINVYAGEAIGGRSIIPPPT